MPIGAAFGNLLNLGANKLLNFALPVALDVGAQFATGLVTRELNRAARNDSDDAFKALLRAASNAVSPTVAIGQTAVPAGGPATGTAYLPATLVPPSIQPPARVLQTNPDFFPKQTGAAFQTSRRPPELFRGGDLFDFNPRASVPQTQNVGLVTAGAKIFQRLKSGFGTASSRVRRGAEAFDPRTPIGRRMLGVAAGGVAVETAGRVGLDMLFPNEALAPSGNPLRVGANMPVAPPVTGLPQVGRFQKEANGCNVQWYFWDGTGGQDPQPIDRSQADCFRKDCIFRLDVFKGKFIKLGSRRMNPMNVRAFFRAGRRVDAGERICRKMFSEKRKQKTGTIRRKSKARKK